MKTVIYGKILIDGTGGEPLERPAVLIEDNVIRQVNVRDQIDIPTDAELLDLSEKVLLPGLIDVHVHLDGWRDWTDWSETVMTPVPLAALRAAGDVRKLLMAGFTSVRCAGSSAGLFLKKAVQEGVVPGPTIKAAGRALSMTGGIPDAWRVPLDSYKAASQLGMGWGEIVDGPDAIREAVRRRRREGADLIKCFASGGILSRDIPADSPAFTRQEMEALVEEAHRLGLFVACHAHHAQGIRNAVQAGVDSIEHGTFLDDECIELMVKKGTCLSPTFSVLNKVCADTSGRIPESNRQQAQKAKEYQSTAFIKAYRAGVKIVCGSDCTGKKPLNQFGENAQELLRMAEAGMAPMDVIVAATSIAARAIGLEDAGVISEGKKADIIAVDENPLKMMETLLQVPFVMQGGKTIKHTK